LLELRVKLTIQLVELAAVQEEQALLVLQEQSVLEVQVVQVDLEVLVALL
jgi:hypothetical protein